MSREQLEWMYGRYVGGRAGVGKGLTPEGHPRRARAHLGGGKGPGGRAADPGPPGPDPSDILTRRRLLHLAGGGYLGLTLGGLWQAQAAGLRGAPAGKPIRACILVFYYGGPSHLDTYDLK